MAAAVHKNRPLDDPARRAALGMLVIALLTLDVAASTFLSNSSCGSAPSFCHLLDCVLLVVKIKRLVPD